MLGTYTDYVSTKLIDESGRSITCTLLFEVEAPDGARVIAYTDNSVDEQGNTRVGCARVLSQNTAQGADGVISFEIGECTAEDKAFVSAVLQSGGC